MAVILRYWLVPRNFLTHYCLTYVVFLTTAKEADIRQVAAPV